jgi:hypothetical protein
MRVLAAVFILALAPALASGQPAASRAKRPPVTSMAKNDSPWSSMVRYSVLSDYADNRTPRGYTHSVMGSLAYNFTKQLSFDVGAGARAETIEGQISKGKEQSYDEVISPMTSFDLSYERGFLDDDKYSVYAEGEPLWDEASRLEGYKAVLGLGGNVSLRMFGKRWVLTNDLSVSELINSYKYGSNLTANPDYFYTYKLSNVVKIYRGLRASYSFGAKVTRYMDDFIGYSYSNSFSLSYVWPHLSVGLAYDNGGFTDDGTVSLWYLDQYRRLARLVVGYTF